MAQADLPQVVAMKPVVRAALRTFGLRMSRNMGDSILRFLEDRSLLISWNLFIGNLLDSLKDRDAKAGGRG